jgi:hypothetical protein
LDATGMQQRHKGPRAEIAATPGKQGDILWGPRPNHRASRRVSSEDSEYECQDIMEEPATAQTKEETTRSLEQRM